jgi:hypothetical protein
MSQNYCVKGGSSLIEGNVSRSSQNGLLGFNTMIVEGHEVNIAFFPPGTHLLQLPRASDPADSIIGLVKAIAKENNWRVVIFVPFLNERAKIRKALPVSTQHGCTTVTTFERGKQWMNIDPRSPCPWGAQQGLIIIDAIEMIGDKKRGPVIQAILHTFQLLPEPIRILVISRSLDDIQANSLVRALGGTSHRWWDSAPICTISHLPVHINTFVKVAGQVVIFTRSPARARDLARHLAAQLNNCVPNNTLTSINASQELTECLIKKVAFHTGELILTTRITLEQAFADRQIRVLVTTSTLALSHVIKSVSTVLIDDFEQLNSNPLRWIEAVQLRRLAAMDLFTMTEADCHEIKGLLSQMVIGHLADDPVQFYLELRTAFPDVSITDFHERTIALCPPERHGDARNRFKDAEKMYDSIDEGDREVIRTCRLPIAEFSHLRNMIQFFLKNQNAANDTSCLLFWSLPEQLHSWMSIDLSRLGSWIQPPFLPLGLGLNSVKTIVVRVLEKIMSGQRLAYVALCYGIPAGCIEQLVKDARIRAKQMSRFWKLQYPNLLFHQWFLETANQLKEAQKHCQCDC